MRDENNQIRLFSKVDYEMKIKILKHQKSLFHKLKQQNKGRSNEELMLTSLVHAIKEMTLSLDDISLKSFTIRGKNIKSEIKKEKLLSYWAIVKTLRERENMSFRQISKYFLKYHKFEVSYSTIQKTWNKIERKENKNG